jgi:hypothetical protein
MIFSRINQNLCTFVHAQTYSTLGRKTTTPELKLLMLIMYWSYNDAPLPIDMGTACNANYAWRITRATAAGGGEGGRGRGRVV